MIIRYEETNTDFYLLGPWFRPLIPESPETTSCTINVRCVAIFWIVLGAEFLLNANVEITICIIGLGIDSGTGSFMVQWYIPLRIRFSQQVIRVSILSVVRLKILKQFTEWVFKYIYFCKLHTYVCNVCYTISALGIDIPLLIKRYPFITAARGYPYCTYILIISKLY